MKISKRAIFINWITAFFWLWALLCAWTVLPIPESLKPNMALAAFIILALQILAHCDVKTIICLKDREANFIAIIGILTIICLLLAHSNPGAFFSVINLCLLWYLSDKWSWNQKQIFFMGVVYLCLYAVWIYNPMLFGDRTNTNVTGTVSVFLMLTLICCIRFLFPNRKWTIMLEIILVFLSFRKLFIFHGRGSLVALSLYVVLRLLIFSTLWQKERLYKLLCYILTLGSLFFVFIYTALWKIAGSDVTFTLLGKSLFSGREKIWYEVWTYFKSQPFIGIGSNVELQSWFEYNLHNALYNILITHGIIVFILVIVFMLRKMLLLYSKYSQYSLFIPVLSGVFAIYMGSFFEMDLIWFPEFLVWTFMLVVLASAPAAFTKEPLSKEPSK